MGGGHIRSEWTTGYRGGQLTLVVVGTYVVVVGAGIGGLEDARNGRGI